MADATLTGEATALQRVRVAVDAPQHSGLTGPLDYLGPQDLAPGTIVKVGLGRRESIGIVWDAAAVDEDALAESELRPIGQALESLPPLSDRWRRLLEFAAGYYQRSVGELAVSVLPPQLRDLDAKQLHGRLKKLDKAEARAAQALPSRSVDPGVAPPATASSAEDDALAMPDPPLDDGEAAATASGEAELDATLPLSPPPLTAQQQTALDAVRALYAVDPPPPALLWGLTGSGKTEIYLRAAEDALLRGQQVLVLVPEINLTPQLEARFAARFSGHSIVSLHSRLTPAQRLRHWLSAHLGRAQLVLGTRLALFASMPRLGLIVVDEEHDPSYKQQDGARYSARDLAVYRAHLERIPVLLGSATPSLESWQHALSGRYRRIDLTERIGGGALPRVRLFDMNRLERKKGVTTALSMPLLEAMRQRLARGEQSMVFLNRRGYAPVLHCDQCNWKSDCPHCSAHQVFHKEDRTLRCHHCGVAQRVPRACPSCGNPDIAPLGRGTERLEEQLAAALPGARIARIDADTTKLKGSLEAQLTAVHDGEVDVLVGTQMVAKGHDFRRITLVAAVNPDGALFSSDFRAPERLFSLLMQAGGRAGRDAAQAGRSEMWIQTWYPEHALYQSLQKHDYQAFASSQLAERQSAGLPPFAHLALVRAEGRTVEAAREFLVAAQEAAQQLPLSLGLLIYPPVPMSMARVADVERFQMLIEAGNRAQLQRFLRDWLPDLHGLKKRHKGLVRWAVDIDPLVI
ncbi:primosomal protein N' [Roseateles amylovorans]|uniref:Replication restart protein PriA n=1 Tax=Roseateles amylovorans TaxID=2978473 RepID=A0ABY6B5M1_9BURK|nr:primosomal protein N' [Roseateles amylovorans]UXH78828.1 primosomal protein N' [Roseateles amylovorans]